MVAHVVVCLHMQSVYDLVSWLHMCMSSGTCNLAMTRLRNCACACPTCRVCLPLQSGHRLVSWLRKHVHVCLHLQSVLDMVSRLRMSMSACICSMAMTRFHGAYVHVCLHLQSGHVSVSWLRLCMSTCTCSLAMIFCHGCACDPAPRSGAFMAPAQNPAAVVAVPATMRQHMLSIDSTCICSCASAWRDSQHAAWFWLLKGSTVLSN